MKRREFALARQRGGLMAARCPSAGRWPRAVAAGFVDSLAKPRGNVSGFMTAEYGVAGKWLELLREIKPDVTRAAALRGSTIITLPVGLRPSERYRRRAALQAGKGPRRVSAKAGRGPRKVPRDKLVETARDILAKHGVQTRTA